MKKIILNLIFISITLSMVFQSLEAKHHKRHSARNFGLGLGLGLTGGSILAAAMNPRTCCPDRLTRVYYTQPIRRTYCYRVPVIRTYYYEPVYQTTYSYYY